MKTHLPWIISVTLATWTGITLGQQPPASWRAEDSYVEILKEPNRRPILAIRYPWKVHLQPSVEIRRLADNEADTGEIRPLRFVGDLMKGDVKVAAFQCRDRSAQLPLSRKFDKAELKFEIIGAKNRLGNGAAYALVPPDPKVEGSVARAAYVLLDSWALDERTLLLELPEQHFSEPGRVRVWFFREGTVLWWKTVLWPGQAK